LAEEYSINDRFDPCPGEKFKDGVKPLPFPEIIGENTIREKILNFLLKEKGYLLEDIEQGNPFELRTEKETFRLRVSLIIKIKERPLVLIKCGAGSVLARERPALALARLFSDTQVPLTFVTNGTEGLLLNTLNGKTLDSGLEAIPAKNHLLSQFENFPFLPLSEKRIKLEKQILSAFEGLGIREACR
jgi:Type I restriction enzyme R protein N terminus (HSDR_N)